MKRALLALALAACVDAPESGHVWTCTSVLVCDGGRYDFSPAQECIPDDADAEAKYRCAVAPALRAAECSEKYITDVVCETSGLALCAP